MTALRQLQALLPPRAVALVSSPVARHYLTGFASSDGFLLLSSNDALLLVDGRYIEAATAAATLCPVTLLRSFAAQLQVFCRSHRAKRLFVLVEHTTLADVARFRKAVPGLFVELHDRRLDLALTRLRLLKSPDEVQAIRSALRMAERALGRLQPELVPGLSEREIAARLEFFMRQEGSDGVSFETIALVGANSSLPHGVPGDARLQADDVALLDFGALSRGYHSDTTRTLFVGQPSSKQKEIYGVVLRAMAAAIAVAAPGVPCTAVDAAARDVICAAGYGDFFLHSTGHGVGLEIHEEPSLHARAAQTLQSGMVITIEPGIYLPGDFGVRIEDMLLITDSGCENLTFFEK